MPPRKKRKHAGRPPIFDAKSRTEFLRLMREEGLPVSAAAERVGVTEGGVYARARRYPKFKEKLERARQASMDHLETKLQKMAIDGNITAIFGMLRANRPDKWRESKHVDLSNKDGSLKQHINTFLQIDSQDGGMPRQLQGGETHH